MSEAQYRAWLADGSPYALVRPLAELRDLLRGYGYTVYDRGNRAHMLADPPEDHTPYSATGWPNEARYGYGYAVDIMPPGARPLPSLQQLGARLHADRNAGRIPWLKYMNWEPEGDYAGPCQHCTWTPDHASRTSSDRGHIHLSARTGYEAKSSDGYDPVATIKGDDMTPAEFAKILDDPTVAAKMRALPWQYRGGGIPAGMSTLGVINELIVRARAGADQVDEQQIVAGLLAGFPVDRLAELVVAELPAADAERFVDALRDRLARPVDEPTTGAG